MEPAAPGPTRLIPYEGDVLRVLGESPGLAVCELTVPPRFAGPPAHIHYAFDEAIYVLSGALTMTRGQTDPEPAPAGTLILAPRGIRHTFANPTDEPVQVLGVWRGMEPSKRTHLHGGDRRRPSSIRSTRCGPAGGDLPTPQQRADPMTAPPRRVSSSSALTR